MATEAYHYSKPYCWKHITSTRHHSPAERYVGADGLLTAMRAGWQIDNPVMREEIPRRAGRQVAVYHFALHRNGQQRQMTVVQVPCLKCIIRHKGLQVAPHSSSQDPHQSAFIA